MKLSTKIILPIILISALLILFAGCVMIPDSPGYTPGTITGIIAAPCCSTSTTDTVSNPPENWCCPNTEISCKKDFFLQNNIEVILTYGEDEVDTTTTNEKGEYTFTDVPPAKNYVITVFCPDDDKLLVKDVATEVVGGKIFDAEITDWVSTSLGLVVDYLVDNTTVLGPENIELEEVIEDKCAFIHFPAFLRLVIEVRRVGEECGDLYADDAVKDALCKAAEEVGRIVIPDLDLGCVTGYTPGPTPPGPCDGNTKPSIDEVTLNDGGTIYTVSSPSTIHLVVGTSYIVVISASDDNILPQPLTYSLTITKGTNPSFDIDMGSTNTFTGTPLVGDVGTYTVYVNVNDGCTTTTWGPVTVNVGCNEPPVITSQPITSVCLGDEYTYDVNATDPESDPLTYSLTTKPDGMNISFTGLITWTPASDGSYPVTVEVSDGCSSVTQEFNVIVDENFDEVKASGTGLTLCLGDTGSMSVDILTGVELWYQGSWIKDVSLTDPRLSFSSKTAGILSFTGEDFVAVGVGSTDITVTYTPDSGECGTAQSVDLGIVVIVDQCLDCFVLNVKLGGVIHTYTQDYFGGVLLPGEIYVVNEDFSNASKFQFMFNCPPGTLEYNYYRGFSCGGSWESGYSPPEQPDSSAPPPVWLADPLLKNGVFYPAKLSQGLLLCQRGGNILKIRVNGDDTLVFTFELGRNLP